MNHGGTENTDARGHVPLRSFTAKAAMGNTRRRASILRFQVSSISR